MSEINQEVKHEPEDLNEEMEAEISSTSNQDVKACGQDKATCMLVLGMAGSGKTTFVQKLAEHLYDNEMPGYLVNLDPACKDMPYPANIDIRDTINYKKVMKDYGLGPNGAIITSMNLFFTKIDQLIKLVEDRAHEHKHLVFDTPGQIEVFNWSASGMVITETLASQMPTVIVYVIDTVRNRNPATFMSNMLYACSILYKTKLPIVIVLNKTDLQSADFIEEWMRDFEKFQEALDGQEDYVSGLTRSLSLVLDEFYANLKTVGISSVTGVGMNEFLKVVEEAKQEYLDIYHKERIAMNQSTRQVAAGLSSMTLKEGAIPEEDEETLED